MPGEFAPHERTVICWPTRERIYPGPLLEEARRAHAELARAIRLPAEAVGVGVDEALLTRLIADVCDQPGALPLLQFSLTELFERREQQMMTLSDYEQIGGVRGALANRAEALYSGLDSAQQEAARQLFLRLVTVGEGSEDTRRRVPRSELELAVRVAGPNGDEPSKAMPAITTAMMLSITTGEGKTAPLSLRVIGRSDLEPESARGTLSLTLGPESP